MRVGGGFRWAKFRLDFRSRHLRGPGDRRRRQPRPAAGATVSEVPPAAIPGTFCRSRAVALAGVIGQMEGMRPPSTRMMLPVM